MSETCPKCGGTMYQTAKWNVRGEKDGVKGKKASYKCKKCQHKELYFTIKQSDYDRRVESFQETIREKAEAVSKYRLEIQELRSALNSGYVKRQVENIEKVLSRFKKRLP